MSSTFTDTLKSLMDLRGLNDESLASLMVDKGYPGNERSIRYWRTGYLPANWDVVVPLLADIFSVPPVVFFAGLSSYDGESRSTSSYPSFSAALQSRIPRRGAAILARQLTEEGYPTSRQQVATWLGGGIPRDGLTMLPMLAHLLDIELFQLIPGGTDESNQ